MLAYGLNYPKGSRLLSRILRFVSREQALQIFSLLLARFECLDVSNIQTGATNDEPIDIFMSNVIPLLVNVVSESSFVVTIAFTRIILERHNIVWFAKSRVGLSILSMLLSRAEILKQGATVARGEIYTFLFQSIQGQFASLFPHSATSIDNIYVWQFLSAMAVGASGIDHQRVLVTEVREQVMHASKSGDPKALDNVNLFLNALGLGISASQLAAMQA
nr:hypothetical protein HK105_007806 [Polyrhizophydium stewartii]